MINLIASISPFNSYYDYDYNYESEIGAIGVAIFLIGLAIFTLITYLITSISLFVLLRRANHVRPWSAFIPLWNTITLLEFGGLNKAWLWTIIIFFGSWLSSIPIIGWIASLAALAISVIVTVYAAIGIQAGFGRGNAFGVVAAVLFYPIWLIWLLVVGKDWSLQRMRGAQTFFWNDAVGKDNYRIFANESPTQNQGFAGHNPYQASNPYANTNYGNSQPQASPAPYGVNTQPNENWNGYQAPDNNNYSNNVPPQQNPNYSSPIPGYNSSVAHTDSGYSENNLPPVVNPPMAPQNPFQKDEGSDQFNASNSANENFNNSETYVHPYDESNYEDELNPSNNDENGKDSR